MQEKFSISKMAKVIVFDASTLISLAGNNLLRIIGPLKKQYKGKFFIPQSIKYELIDKPMKSKQYKLEALQLLKEISKEHLQIFENNEISSLTKELTELSNSIYKVRNNFICISHHGEMSVIAAAKLLNTETVMIDERTTRMLIEDPNMLLSLLQNKLHTKVTINEQNLKNFKKYVKDLKVLRSSELCLIAYELGLFNHLIEKSQKFIENPKLNLVDALLWSVRLKGCAISSTEINEFLRLEGFSKI